MPGWDRIYPDKRIVTLILDPFEAEELLAQALAEGRRIGERTIMGMPMIAFGDFAGEPDTRKRRPANAKPVDPVDLDNWRALGRKIEHSPEKETGLPDRKVVILPVVRRESLPEKQAETMLPAPSSPNPPERAEAGAPSAEAWSRFKGKALQLPPNSRRAAGSRSILDEQPPRESPPPKARAGMSAADRALIDQAIAQGRVTKCPDFKHSVEPGQLLPGEGWKKGAAKKGKKKSSKS